MSDLLALQRRTAIGELLAREGRVIASALAETFRVSEDTVRRDLREMAQAGLCRRVYGGALPIAPGADTSLGLRQAGGAGRKAALGRALAAAIPRGSLVFIDAGSTNLAIAEALDDDAALTVVTNAPSVAARLGERPGIECIVLGGRLDPRTGACLGSSTLREAERFRPGVAVLGVCGVDAEAGITAHGLEEAELKSAVAARSATLLVAATNDKLGTAAPYGVAPAGWVGTLFVEADCDAATLEPFAARGVPIVRAGSEDAAAARPAGRA
ncbi:DeoR/GlpR family DNA-binding transcription regulator [Aureimonas leprariae]|uniref:DeoR/GlpR transcriptional regulator n=1 Tax=Plantimonas leprariae TaxID=2615207 RepID=A0A7V7TZD6_9HYPH|nr:DeoR/GlpR family DNA-binding transcription regulator [Aureimonas leprariae]KAB0679257.1 DeoR/GlpR transcriptional regulator [Aureimonas leprariae]